MKMKSPLTKTEPKLKKYDYWFHTKHLAMVKASHLRQNYRNVKIKKVKTKAFGYIYAVYHGGLK